MKTRVAKLQKWLAPRCHAIQELHFTAANTTATKICSQAWVNVLVILVGATYASLREIDVCLGMQGRGRQLSDPVVSVLAFTRAISRCQSLTNLAILFLENCSLHKFDLTALPRSLQRLQLSFGSRNLHDGHLRRPIEGHGISVLNLTALRDLPHLTSLRLGPYMPLACSLPAGLSRLTELYFHSRDMRWIDRWVDRAMRLQQLDLYHQVQQGHVRLPLAMNS